MSVIDPNIMNAQLQGESRYQKATSFSPETPQFEMSYDDEEETGPAPGDADFRDYNNPIHTTEEELAPGLYQSDIDSWKRQFGDIWLANIKGDKFVYRALERYEYKEIVSVPNADPLMREEMICEYCILYPQGYDFATMANKKAGVPAVLSELIMEHSAFTREVEVTKL